MPGSSEASGRARNTLIFSIATGLSRVAGLVREMVASAIYGASGPASAFTLAFTVPNLLRSLFADMALSAAFVPVFTDLLEQKRRREALLLISTLFWVLLGGLAILVVVAMLAAPLYMPLFVGDEVRAGVGSSADGLVTGLSQVMLPTVLLLGLNGLLVGALNAYGHFTIPALSPLVWNGVIIVVNLALLPAFDGPNQIYAQAIGVLVGTVVQLLMAVPVLRRYGIRVLPRVDLSDPRLRQVLLLMVPVALSLGLINFSALINSVLASHVDDDGPRAIEAAFRLYMLPQGIFSVAIVTVLFPALSRAVSRRDQVELRSLVSGGMGQIVVLLVPVGLLFMSPVISHDIIATLFQRGKWTDENTDATTVALVWFGASLALNGVSLLLSRTFFALQRPWANTGLALGSLVAATIASLALYRPLGIAGIVLGTFVGNVALVGLQIRLLRRETGGPLGLLPVVRSLIQVLVASVVAVGVATGVALLGRVGADHVALGTERSTVTMAFLGLAVIAGAVTYVGLARELRLRELDAAGARFVRLGARLGGIAGRLPGARLASRLAASAPVRVLGRLLELLAWPLVLASTVARAIAGGLVALVPGPVVAGGGPATLPDLPGGGGGRPARRATGAGRRGVDPRGGGGHGAGGGPTGTAAEGAPGTASPRTGRGVRRDAPAVRGGRSTRPTVDAGFGRAPEAQRDDASGTETVPLSAAPPADAVADPSAEPGVAPGAEAPTRIVPPRGAGARRRLVHPAPGAPSAEADASDAGPAPDPAAGAAPGTGHWAGRGGERPDDVDSAPDPAGGDADRMAGGGARPDDRSAPDPAAGADPGAGGLVARGGARPGPAPSTPVGAAPYDAAAEWPTAADRGEGTLQPPWPSPGASAPWWTTGSHRPAGVGETAAPRGDASAGAAPPGGHDPYGAGGAHGVGPGVGDPGAHGAQRPADAPAFFDVEAAQPGAFEDPYGTGDPQTGGPPAARESRLEAYGVRRPSPEEEDAARQARQARREQAERLLAAREAALERIAERQRRREEGGGGRRRRRR